MIINKFQFNAYPKSVIPKCMYLLLILLSIILNTIIIIGIFGFTVKYLNNISNNFNYFDIVLNILWAAIISVFVLHFMLLNMNRYKFSKLKYIEINNDQLILPFLYLVHYPKKIKVDSLSLSTLSIVDYSTNNSELLSYFNRNNKPYLNFIKCNYIYYGNELSLSNCENFLFLKFEASENTFFLSLKKDSIANYDDFIELLMKNIS